MKLKQFYFISLLALLMASCQAPRLGYFQDVQSGQVQQLQPPKLVTVQPGDKLSILVGSKDPGLAYLFNLNIVGRYRTSQSEANLTTNQVASYTVDEMGEIDFPVMGKLMIKGMTRREVSDYIKNQLISRSLLKDPVVTVDFLDMTYSVLGEVNSPGRFLMDHDKTTLIDALSRAGDLSIMGRRDNVLVMREENGQEKAYRIDLTNLESLYASPVYSIISLSPTMYDKLYDGLDKARFVGVSHWKGKYVFDISAYADRLKRHYPIRACLFPEISTDVAEPRVELCDSKERNSAITQVAHSTLLQMWSRGLKQHQSDQAFILDVIRMLNGMEFYKIILTPDIYKNAVCLKKFLQSTDN